MAKAATGHIEAVTAAELFSPISMEHETKIGWNGCQTKKNKDRQRQSSMVV
jgi:hypothetical protein